LSKHCVVLFSECGFRGEHIEVCDDVANIKEEKDFENPRALYIPDGFTHLPVYLHTEVNFQGKESKFDESE